MRHEFIYAYAPTRNLLASCRHSALSLDMAQKTAGPQASRPKRPLFFTMSLIFDDPRTDSLLRYLNARKQPATFAEIAGQVQPPLPRRSVQRWLAALVQVGVLNRDGGRRHSRYSLRTRRGILGAVTWRDGSAESPASGSQPVSPAGAKTRPEATHASHSAGRVAAAGGAAAQPKPSPTSGATAQPSELTAAPAPPLAQFSELFATSAAGVITARNDRERAQLSLETDAAIYGLKPGEMKSYIPAALAELNTMTVDQARRLGVTADQFTVWREVYPATSG